MNYTQRLGGRWTVGLAVAALASMVASLTAAPLHQGFAKVRYVVGQAEYAKPGGQKQKLEKGMALQPGDTIYSGAGAHVDIALGNNNGSIEVAPDSELKLDTLTWEYSGLEVVHNTQLSLSKGVVYGQVNKMNAASKYEVKTPKAVAGIRGTRYRIAANGDVTVSEGTVIISIVQPDGSIKTFTITAGNTLVAATGTIRPATDQELKDVNTQTLDAMTHGGYDAAGLDPDTKKFLNEGRQEPFVSPTLPLR
ncbi:MAG: FecR domain-containing protein [Verrucomicrobia bacterium]|nr:FecR domain-containing protein [Verrucomicrobiota bacterium]